MRQKLLMILIGLTLLLVLSACSTRPQVTGAVASDPTVEWNGEVKEFTVRAFQFGYEPSRLEVNLGDKVVINGYTSDVPHSLSIAGFGVHMKLTSKKPVRTEFIADKSGSFNWYCRIPCGRGHGSMSGTLVVKG